MITENELAKKISKFSRSAFAHLPTPLERLNLLSSDLNRNDIWVKREDTTGLAFGGNKARHYEFEMPHILESGYDVIINIMDYYSNNARMTAAAANKFGITYVLILKNAKGKSKQGNRLLDELLGSEIHLLDTEESKDALEYGKTLAKNLIKSGKKPYLLQEHRFPEIVGTIAYVNATLELREQIKSEGIENVHIYGVAGRSLCGLILGAKNLGLDWKFTGVMVTDDPDLDRYIFNNAEYIKDLIDLEYTYSRDDLGIKDQYIGEGYGILTPSVKSTILKLARLEGLFVDPNYSGPVLNAIIDDVENDHINENDNIVFLHTGGLPSIFSYAEELTS